MSFKVGDMVRHFGVAPGHADTKVEAVGECEFETHQNEEGGPCGQPTVTVIDPTTGNSYTGHDSDFVKVE